MPASLLSVFDRPLTVGRAILYGTLVVGVLDGLDAVIFFGLRGAAPARIFQSIAAGLLGRAAAADGGVPTALLGVVLHFVVACGIVTTYVLASRAWPALARKPLVFGPLYGVTAFFVMNLVVMPLSAIGGPVRFSTPGLVNGLLIHGIVVGPVSAMAAAWASLPSRTRVVGGVASA